MEHPHPSWQGSNHRWKPVMKNRSTQGLLTRDESCTGNQLHSVELVKVRVLRVPRDQFHDDLVHASDVLPQLRMVGSYNGA